MKWPGAFGLVLLPATLVAAVLGRWDFEDEAELRTRHTVTGGAEIVRGGSGRALLLDGFSGWLRRPAADCPSVAGSFSVTAWIAPGAYPLTWAPILDAADPGTGGFSLGLDAQGRLQFTLRAGGVWRTVTSAAELRLNRWVHVRAVWREGEGMSLRVDGALAGQSRFSAPLDPLPTIDWLIGRSRLAQRPAGALRPEATADVYSYLDAVLDDLVVSNDTAEDPPAPGAFAAVPPLPARILPAGPAGPGPFGAYAVALSYYPQWDLVWRTGPAADVVVRFDTFPGRLVFWRGTSYIPHWVTENGIWFTNEFNETWGDMRGSGEPMSDKQCRYSRVAILESGEARAVVHWRYALTDVFYHIARADPATDWGDWSDEVYTIYPDGTAVREITLHTSAPTAPHEWHEAIVVMGPGFTPERSLEPAALTVVGKAGAPVTFSWEKETPPWTPAWPADCTIQLVHTRSRYRPFTLVRPQDRGSFNIFAKEVRRDVSMFPWWNHWPAAPNPSDGRYAFAADRPSHASLSNIAWEPSATGPDWIRKVMLTGLTDRSAADLRPLLAAWSNPPRVEVTGAGDAVYDAGQKAWTLTASGPVPVQLTLHATPESPVENPAVIVRQWGDGPVALLRDGRPLVRGVDYRVQWRRGLDGTDLVLWLPLATTTVTRLELRPVAN